MSVFVEIHAIHSVPPSNLNRDDNGSPKTAVFGGVKRHRVSSQSWKRAVRQYFAEHNSGENLGFRTRNVAELVANALVRIRPDLTKDEALSKADVAVNLATGSKKEAKKTDALFLISERQIENLAEILATIENPKEHAKAIKASLVSQNSLDLALFGRMVASATDLNVEATAQVAHAISTHEVSTEFDFFTAVDDFSMEDNAGAGMMGDVEFTASTLYRYAVVDATALAKQFEGNMEIVTESLDRFLNAFVRSVPSGKQNTFAARTLPDAVLIVVRSDQPTSLANAFEKPVAASEEGYVEASVVRLVDAAKKSAATYGDEDVIGRYAVSSASDEASEKLAEIADLGSLKEVIANASVAAGEVL